MEQDKRCLVIWIRHGARADQGFANLFFGSGTKIDFKFDPPLTEEGKVGAQRAGNVIREEIVSRGFGECPVKVLSSPLLRTLQTAAQVCEAVPESGGRVHINEHLAVKLKSGLKKNPLEHGALAQIDREALLRQYLDSKVTEIVPDAFCQLPKLEWPEDDGF